MRVNNEGFTVREIPPAMTHEWLLKKHYAHCLPGSIMFAFGLYNKEQILQGVCTFGMPCVEMNNGKCIFENYSIRTLELTHLVINDGSPKNIGSFFIGGCFTLLPRPTCLVSFADPNHGHHGYIYQATNWLYTGNSLKGGLNKHFVIGGRDYHGKSLTEGKIKDIIKNYDNDKTMSENIIASGGSVVEETELKHRYIYFLGDKRQLKEMKANLKYEILPYPKGDNQRYDASYEPTPQGVLI